MLNPRAAGIRLPHDESDISGGARAVDQPTVSIHSSAPSRLSGVKVGEQRGFIRGPGGSSSARAAGLLSVGSVYTRGASVY
jgi:hypothetical protein